MNHLSRFLSEICCSQGRAAAKARSGPVSFAHQVSIEVAAPDGAVHKLQFRADATVEAVKALLEVLVGIPSCEQRLVALNRDWTALVDEELDDESRLVPDEPNIQAKFRVERASKLHEARSHWCVFRYRSRCDDADKFDEVANSSDVAELIQLMASSQAVDVVLEPKHPWAVDPKTIGALACAHLASAAAAEAAESESASNGESEPQAWQIVKRTAFEAQAVPALVGFLRSKQEDRVQAAVLCLRFLTDRPGGALTAIAAYDEGAMPLLIAMLGSRKAIASAAASTLRNIFIASDAYRQDFVDLGGVEGLVWQLGGNDSAEQLQLQIVLETILNLQDLFEDVQGHTREDFAQLAIRAGAIDRLQELLAASDSDPRADQGFESQSFNDFRSSVVELLSTLEAVREKSPRQEAPGGG